MLSDLSSQNNTFAMLSDLNSQPRSQTESQNPTANVTSSVVGPPALAVVPPDVSPQQLLGIDLLNELTSAPPTSALSKPLEASLVPAVTPREAIAASPAPAQPAAAAFDLNTANRLNEADRAFIEAFSRAPESTRNPDPNGGPVFSIVMHEAMEGGFLVNYVFEANFETKTYKRIKRKRKI